MTLHRPRLRRLAAAGAALGLAVAGLVGVQLGTAAPASAATSQFHGVNWADPDDNFITRPNTPVGLSTSDSYATVYAKATNVLKGFKGLGANTVRFGINTWTTSSSWWNSLVGAYDAANALGMNVIITPWLQGGKISDTNAFNSMWDTVVAKYGGNSNVYFDMMNEPYGYSASDLTNTEAAWVNRYSSIPRSRMILPGQYSDNNLCAVGGDSRLSGTLLSLHIYSMFGDSHSTESGWVSDLQGNLCGYGSRAVITEFGVPMTTGVNYNGPRDGTNNISYLYAVTDTARSQGIGTVLWTGVKTLSQTQGPGPCDNASCAITTVNGSGTNLSLSLNNQSGLDRLQYGWNQTNNSGGSGGPGGGTSFALRGNGSNRCLDVTGRATANGTAVEIWDCNGGTNQQWTQLSNGALQVYGNKCLDVPGHATATGTKVEIWDCNGGANQQWTLNSDGTVVGRESGLCLDVTGSGTANGTAVQLWTCSGAANQKWTRQ
ncbi:RICIN domain-containing protein [Dactylosporangium sp. McL0621]|uniref:RICIN domain-containing protein n=1 Tax=Dactylosporangium sp. McL0621 TaxID=3415678 RepID=UPI003CEA84F1